MSGVFTLPVGATQPDLTDTLRGSDGQPVNLSGRTVTLVLTDRATPFAERTLAGSATVVSAAAGTVRYVWAAADTEEPFSASIGWQVTGTGFDQLFLSSRWAAVNVTDNVGLSVPLITPGDIEVDLGRALSVTEYPWAVALIAEATAVLEGWLHRDLVPRRRTERHVIGATGVLTPDWGPVQGMVSLDLGDGPTTALNATWREYRFAPGQVVIATYDSGDAEPNPAARSVVRQAVAAPIIAGNRGASGALSSYSVEGTSITYGPAATASESGVGRMPVANLRAVRFLRRTVVRW